MIILKKRKIICVSIWLTNFQGGGGALKPRSQNTAFNLKLDQEQDQLKAKCCKSHCSANWGHFVQSILHHMWPEVCLLKWGQGAECRRNSHTLCFPATKIIKKWPIILKHSWKMTRKNSSTVSDSLLEQIFISYWKKIVVLKETEKLLGVAGQLKCTFRTPYIFTNNWQCSQILIYGVLTGAS